MKLTKIEIVSAFGFVVGIAGLILSVYFYQAQKRFKGLAFIVDPMRTLVVSPGHLPSPHLTLLDKEGKHVMNDVYSTEMYVWNSGTETILGQDIIVPLKVVIPPEVRLLDVRTTNVSRQQVTQAAAAVQSGGEQITGVAITFRVLEPT